MHQQLTVEKSALRRSWSRPPAWVRSLEMLLAILIVAGGVGFIAVTPVGMNSDEGMHFLRAYQISKGGLIAQENKPGVAHDDGRLIGGEIPDTIVETLRTTGALSPLGDVRPVPSVDWSQLPAYDRNGGVTFTDLTGAAPYPPLAYLPGVMGILVGKLLGLPILIWLYLGRVLGMIVTGALMVAAVRVTPTARWAFFTVAALPGMIGQLSAFGADGMTLAVCTLTVAYILRLAMQSRAVSLIQYSAVAGLGVAVALVKPSYLPLGLLLLVIPILNARGPALRRWLSVVAAGAPAIAVALFWAAATAFVNAGVNPANDLAIQREFVLHNPGALLGAMWNTFILDYPSGVSVGSGTIYREIFGSFASLQATMPMLFVLLLTGALTVSVFLHSREDTTFLPSGATGLASRGVVLLTIVVTVFATAAALYLLFTPNYATSVQGLQGRYFLPEVLLVLVMLTGSNRLRAQTTAKVVVVGILAVSITAALCVTYNRFWSVVPPTVYPH